MTAGDARRGRRDNGIVAAAYAAAGDVDPRVGEHLLDVLARHNIAAYLSPSIDQDPITRSTSLPSRPSDRLFVDQRHLQTARDHLAGVTDDTPATATDSDHIDREFSRIVASLRSHEDVARLGADDPVRAGQPSYQESHLDPTSPPAPERSLLDGLDTFGADLDHPDTEGYVPPPPPPIPRPSPTTVFAVVGVVGGLILFLQPSVLPMSETTSMVLGFTALVAGFATLVWRLRPDHDEDGADPDDGARV